MQAGALLSAFLLVRLFAAGMLRARRQQAVMVPVSVDLNRAPLTELMALPGIGRTRAEAIILHRVRHGWFARIEDLQEVDGIGPDTVAGLRPFAIAGSTSRPAVSR